jgi:DNA-binding XRE family transcriptional regulator
LQWVLFGDASDRNTSADPTAPLTGFDVTTILSHFVVDLSTISAKIWEMSGTNPYKRISHLPRLREHRKRRGLTQIELSKISDVSRATIADLEAGKRGAYQSTVRKLARALKVKSHDLKGE